MNDNVIEIKQVVFGSKMQLQSIALRNAVLREPLGLVFSKEELADEKLQIHLVAEVKKEIIGVLILVKINKETIKMRQFAVSTQYQQKGVGKAIVLFAENYCRVNNFQEIVLHAREAACNFYLKLGYKKIGAGFEEVGLPHYRMIKNIG